MQLRQCQLSHRHTFLPLFWTIENKNALAMNLISVGCKLDFLELFILPPQTFNMIRKHTKNQLWVLNHVRFQRLQPIRLLCPWDFPCKNTGMGCHFLFQGIFPTQGLNPHILCLLHCRQIFYRWATCEVHKAHRERNRV